MRNIKLVIEYDGSSYAGWQIQQNRQETIQQTLEQTLQKILQHKVKLIGSGRTDAGVHALGQVANFKTDSDISVEKLKKALNALLPKDTVVSSAGEATKKFHSRFDARLKTYRYVILNRDYRPAIMRNNVYFYPYPLDIRLMRSESRCLLGKHNFKAFQASSGKERDPVRTIRRLEVTKTDNYIHIDIEADGFLYNMVRNIVGTLIEVGRGRFDKGYFKKLLLSGDRRLAGPTAPSRGLYLLKVDY